VRKPFQVAQIKELVKIRIIKQNTRIENANGRAALAGTMQGLDFPPDPVQSAVPVAPVPQIQPTVPVESDESDFDYTQFFADTGQSDQKEKAYDPAPKPQRTSKLFCRFCGEEILRGSRFCPNCGKSTDETQSNSTQYIPQTAFQPPAGQQVYYPDRAKPPLSGCGVFLLIFGILGIVGYAIFIANDGNFDKIMNGNSNSSYSSYSSSGGSIDYSNPITVSATDLMQAYVDNAVAADGKYKGKAVIVTGTIQNIGKDIMDTPYVALDTDELIFCVQCLFSRGDEAKLSSLRKGKRIAIGGKCDGALGNVMIKYCVLGD